MRIHVVLDDDLVAEIDRRFGDRKRSEYITRVVRTAIDNEQRWDEIEANLGALTDSDHDWDADPAAWVRSQRRGERRAS